MKKVISVVGTNASGKSDISIELATRFCGEIISADSRQIYRGFDLCSGKASQRDRAAVPHYMIDICDVDHRYSIAEYQEAAYAIIDDIHKRNKTPFVVGGTGLYTDVVIKGYVFEKDEFSPQLRESLAQLEIVDLQNKLKDYGAYTFENNLSEANNKRRLIRRLEKVMAGIRLEPNNKPLYDVLQLGVTWPKEILHQRIEKRLQVRVDCGMFSEIQEYLDAGGSPEHLIRLGLEYKYIYWYLSGKYSDYDEFFTEMSGAIKRFAKRQMTWFRKNESIIWLDMCSDYFSAASRLIEEFLGSA